MGNKRGYDATPRVVDYLYDKGKDGKAALSQRSHRK
jgi:hypothetical protein